MPSPFPRIIYIGAPEADASSFADRARQDFPGIDLLATNDREAAMAAVDAAEVIIGHHFQFSNDMLERAMKLRWIQSLTTGTDNILSLPALRSDVMVTSTRGMHGPQMTELIFLQMLALQRNFRRISANQDAGRWERWPQPLLRGKTAVIVGVGAIAEHLAPCCKAFGMTVHGVSSAARTPHGFDRMFPRAGLHAAAACADFLILVVPLSDATRNMIDASVLGSMKPSAYLINVARGGVLDEEALIQVLQERKIAGAALDVYRQQPLPADHPLWHAPNLICTPLIGGMSNVYLDQAYGIVQHNLQHYLAGTRESMRNVVTH